MARSTGTFFTMFLVSLAVLLVLIVPAEHVKGAGDGTLLKRPPEETCHACHKTDRNAPGDPNSIKSHNSSSTGSTKWSPNGWGVAGGKYGEFLCTTCHTAHETSNLYLIRQTIAAPDGSNWASTGTTGVNVLFKKKASSGNPNPGSPDGVMGADYVLNSTKVCEVCHSQTSHFRWNGGGADQTHSNVGGASGLDCSVCHSHRNGFKGGGRGQAHRTHLTEEYGPKMTCASGNFGCHGVNIPPLLSDGQNLANTTVCDTCHSKNGYYNGVNSVGGSVGAKDNWPDGVYSGGSLISGKEKWCVGCHDNVPAVVNGQTAANKAGDNSTYGYYSTGHGKSTTYNRLSWQDTAAAGNPGANRLCTECHEYTKTHINISGSDKRLKTGYENENNNNCKQCHNPGTVAGADPQWYTTYAAYQGSAHKDKLCSECHDVHGTAGAYAGMTNRDKENLCNNCHTGHAGHALHVSFGKSGKTYSLECVSCHNVHLVTGVTSATNPNVSAMTLFTNNTRVWGDDANEKMNAYVGSGKYATPTGDTMNGTQMPDYPTFCLDCHSTPMAEFGRHGGITWNDDNHGLVSSNVPNGGGASPNWFSFGVAAGWDGDDRTGTQSEAWPVIPRGRGEQIWTRDAYKQEERIAGANFVMSCADCHVTHESGIGAKIRTTVNGAPGSTSHNVMCNACHYYYSDWHAGMSCGNAGCHNAGCWNERICQNQNSLHGIYHASGDGSTRTWNGDLVLNMKFENNLNDSGSFRLHSKWYSGAGSFAAGKVGNAAVFDNGKTVQVGTTNSYWSTDEGYHGTWKYTEMKYNTTLEAWVYPTDNAKNEYTIFNKHVGVSSNGGYAFTLRKVNGTLRATFTMAADNNGFAQDGRAGVRGAYSWAAVPLNRWTHVAATFNTSGPDRNPSDPSVGRIRIYVNGEDVTTSDASGNWMQPGANETSIYAYSENSPWNQGICYNGSWCASEFSIGGFDWETTNFIGRIDEAKVWNITKDASYFASLDSQTAPHISHVEGLIGNNQLTVKFSEGVYTNTGSSGALVPADFVLTDTGGNNPRTITGVTHTAGSSTAVITMSAPLTVADINSDTIAAVSNSIFDNYNNAAGTEAVTMGLSSQCPTSPVTLNLNEASGSTYVMDTQGILYGAVFGGAATLTGSAYSGGGDGSGRYIQFDYNTSCLQASTAMTIETRVKPTGITGSGSSYVRRILARDSGGNWQLSIWKNNSANNIGVGGTPAGNFNAPSNEAVIALWLNPGGSTWKPVLTNYTGAKTGSENNCPIVSDHWYQIKVVWNSSKCPSNSPNPETYCLPADIYIEDQGTDGAGAGKNWTGSINCTDSDESLKTNALKFYTGDAIYKSNGSFTIGINIGTSGNFFNGLIDWIRWKDSVD